jgi:hypothetical protein
MPDRLQTFIVGRSSRSYIVQLRAKSVRVVKMSGGNSGWSLGSLIRSIPPSANLCLTCHQMKILQMSCKMEDLFCNLDAFTSQCKILLSHMPVIAFAMNTMYKRTNMWKRHTQTRRLVSSSRRWSMTFRPVIISNSTTPNPYTSLAGVSCRVMK